MQIFGIANNNSQSQKHYSKLDWTTITFSRLMILLSVRKVIKCKK